MNKRVLLRSVSKTYFMDNGEKLETLNNINIDLNDNEFVSIIGPSGCGKSTVFRLITGLEGYYSGDILINDIKVEDSDETVSYMQQKDLLMPWRTIMDNVILPLEIKGMGKKECIETASYQFAEFGLEGFENSYPNQLSGGMRQRAALLRTFLVGSDIMLLDEPFGALDAITRSNMQDWLLKIWQIYKKSVLFVTHDIDEAIYLSDRIYVMSERPGHIVHELKVDFDRPRTKEILLTEQYLDYKKQLTEKLNY
jgi:NitT/TauT family transport system ATP-binding protein